MREFALSEGKNKWGGGGGQVAGRTPHVGFDCYRQRVYRRGKESVRLSCTVQSSTVRKTFILSSIA